MKAKAGTSKLIRICQLHVAYALVLMALELAQHYSTVVDLRKVGFEETLNPLEYDIVTWNFLGGMLAIVLAVWFIAKHLPHKLKFYKWLVFVLIAADLVIAAFQFKAIFHAATGDASAGVVLFVIPILTAAVLASRRAVLITTLLATALYAYTCVAGSIVSRASTSFQISYYSEVAFNVAILLIVAGLLVTLMNARQKNK